MILAASLRHRAYWPQRCLIDYERDAQDGRRVLEGDVLCGTDSGKIFGLKYTFGEKLGTFGEKHGTRVAAQPQFHFLLVHRAQAIPRGPSCMLICLILRHQHSARRESLVWEAVPAALKIMPRSRRHKGSTTFPQTTTASTKPRQRRMHNVWEKAVGVASAHGGRWENEWFCIRMWATTRGSAIEIWVDPGAAVLFARLPPPAGFKRSRAKKLPKKGLPVAEMFWSGDEDVWAPVFTAGPWENWFLAFSPDCMQGRSTGQCALE